MPTGGLNRIKDVLWAIAIAGAAAAVLRFTLGLGVTTGLNDATPWGLWIAFKLGFVALAGGGFTLAALVYVFHLESFRPVLRRAILLAFLGYGSFIVSLIFDLGLPWHIYMPMIHWQHHSVMFEIAWCVMLYFSVLALEFGPVVLEHPWFGNKILQSIYHLLKRITPVLVIAGFVLSLLHQSSLGSLFLIMPHRVHPLWYSPWIPFLFFTSAIAAGLLAVILESFIADRLFGRGLHRQILNRLGKIAAFVLWLYLGLRLGDLLLRGQLPLAFDGSWQSALFWLEITAGGVLPGILLLIPKFRQRNETLISSAVLGIAGVLSQRMSLSLFTMWRPEGTVYRPSFIETLIAFAILAAAGLMYFLFVEHLAVLESKLPDRTTSYGVRPFFAPGFGATKATGFVSQIARRSGISVLVVALTVAWLPETITQKNLALSIAVQAARGWDQMIINGDQDSDRVRFDHIKHQERFAEEMGDQDKACETCHHINKPEDVGTRCSDCHKDYFNRVSIFDHKMHQTTLGGNQACSECHQGEHLARTAKDCTECHLPESQRENSLTKFAPGYQPAMHLRCLNCHESEAQNQGREELALCSSCHIQEENESPRLTLIQFDETKRMFR